MKRHTSLILPEIEPEKWIVFPEENQIYDKDHILLSEIMKFPIPYFMKGIKVSTEIQYSNPLPSGWAFELFFPTIK